MIPARLQRPMISLLLKCEICLWKLKEHKHVELRMK